MALINTFMMFYTLPSMDQVKVVLVLLFSGLVSLAFIISLIGMIILKIKNDDITIWLNIFLTCLGFVSGILTSLLGISIPTPAG